MRVLVVGASGATGLLLVKHLLESGESVRALVRPNSNLPDGVANHKNLTLIRANLLDISDAEVAELVAGCNAIASCLGHKLSFSGIYGSPRRLVTNSIRRLCSAVREVEHNLPVKVVLMNTTGNSNRDIPEQISFAQSCIIWLLRMLLPPHVDNEKAADFLRTELTSNDSQVEWTVVRPDTLTNENQVTNYAIHPSPTRSAIFDAGTTSRTNVAHFMAKLITDQNTWVEWKGKMPVIYNANQTT